MKIDLKKFQNSLTTNQVLQIAQKLGINEWDDSKEIILFFLLIVTMNYQPKQV